eukprot:1114888-Amphidinium_carterae.2
MKRSRLGLVHCGSIDRIMCESKEPVPKSRCRTGMCCYVGLYHMVCHSYCMSSDQSLCSGRQFQLSGSQWSAKLEQHGKRVSCFANHAACGEKAKCCVSMRCVTTPAQLAEFLKEC